MMPDQLDVDICRLYTMKTIENMIMSLDAGITYHDLCNLLPILSSTCPYCEANERKCYSCDYALTHGRCDDEESTWWQLAVEAMVPMMSYGCPSEGDEGRMIQICKKYSGLFDIKMTLDEFMDCKKAFLRDITAYFPDSEEFRSVLKEY